MTDHRIKIRPKIKKIGSSDTKKEEERFQNETLRPIIKLQHDLLVAFFKNYISVKKIDFNTLPPPKQVELISQIFKNDHALKIEIRGLIIGHFTIDEYNAYQKIASDTNKRIINIIKERLTSLI